MCARCADVCGDSHNAPHPPKPQSTIISNLNLPAQSSNIQSITRTEPNRATSVAHAQPETSLSSHLWPLRSASVTVWALHLSYAISMTSVSFYLQLYMYPAFTSMNHAPQTDACNSLEVQTEKQIE